MYANKDYIVKIRRELHKVPELTFELPKTLAIVRRELEAMGIPYTEEYGISPINYMISCRIEEAKHLLRNDDYPLAHISHVLGFSSPSYFSQTFKKFTGTSPKEYRKAAIQ